MDVSLYKSQECTVAVNVDHLHVAFNQKPETILSYHPNIIGTFGLAVHLVIV